MTNGRDAHFRHSVLREIILEHQFIADLLRRLWQRKAFDVEVLRSEFDAGGYDLVVSRGSLTRHIQLKSKRRGGSTRGVPIGLRLADRPSGCVLCFVVDDELAVDHYLWFGGEPGHPLPTIEEFRVTRHTKGNAKGLKAERPDHRQLPFSTCERIDTLDGVIERLLGPI